MSILDKIFGSKDSGTSQREDLRLLDESIKNLRLGIFAYLMKKKYAPVYGREAAKFWAAAVLNTIVLDSFANKEGWAFYKRNKEKILQDALTIKTDKELAIAVSYLYAALTIFPAATTNNTSQELSQQAMRLGIYIPNIYDICRSDNISDCIVIINNFSKTFLLFEELSGSSRHP